MKLRKHTRIILKIAGYLGSFCILLLLLLFFLLRSFSFQTWLGTILSQKISKESGIDIAVDKIKIDFFHQITLEKIFIGKKYTDTLISADEIHFNLKNFNYKKKQLQFKKINLTNPKFVLHEPEKGNNLLDSLIDFFSRSSGSSSDGSDWKIDPGSIFIHNGYVRISNQKHDSIIPGIFHPDWILFSHLNGQIDSLQFQNRIALTVRTLNSKTNFGISIHSLQTKFELYDTLMKFSDIDLTTNGSRLKGSLKFNYDSLKDFNDFVNKIFIESFFAASSQLCLSELGGFVPEFRNSLDTLKFSGEIEGTIANLHALNMDIRFKQKNILKGDISLLGLPDIPNTFLHAKLKMLKINWNSIHLMSIPPYDRTHFLKLPPELIRTGYLDFRGEVNGTLQDIVLFGKANTGVGLLNVEIELKKNKKFGWEYTGHILSPNLNLQKFLNNPLYGFSSFNLSLAGKGIAIQNVVLEINGKISFLDFKGYRYRNISANGKLTNQDFEGKLAIRDSALNLQFDGKVHYEKNNYNFDFIAEVESFNPEKLHFFSMKDKGYFQSLILIRLRGNDVNNLTGTIHFDDTRFVSDKIKYKLNTFFVELEQNKIPKKITIHSDFLSAKAEGNFRLSHIYEPLEDILIHYYPTFFSHRKNSHSLMHPDVNLSLNLKIKKFKIIHDLFFDKIDIANQSELNVYANPKQHKIQIHLQSDSIELFSVKFKQVLFSVDEKQLVNANLQINEIFVTDSLKMNNLNVCIQSRDKLSVFNIEWKGDTSRFRNNGEIMGKVLFNNESFYLQLDSAFAQIHDSIWTLKQSGIIAWSGNGSVLISKIKLACNNQSILLEGYIRQELEENKLNIELINFNLFTLHPLLSVYGIHIRGIMDACISFFYLKNELMSSAEINISNFALNQNHFGTLVVNSKYLKDEKTIDINGYTNLELPDILDIQKKNISFQGKIFPFSKENNFNVECELRPLNPVIINPFVQDIFQVKKGALFGKIFLTGTFNDPRLNGELTIHNTQIQMEFTRVNYWLNGKIEVMPDQIRFSDVGIYDKINPVLKNNGYINGNIFHRKFSNWQLDFDITYRNMLVLNTTEKDNKLYFGRIFSSGNVGIWGFMDDLNMSVEDTIHGKSSFFLALDNPEEAGDYDFISFRRKDTSDKIPTKKEISNFNLNMHVTASPEFSTSIIFDRTVNNILHENGYGSLYMKFNTLGKFEMTGDYSIESGDYTFALEKIFSKKFDIEKGSRILWTGDPINGDIDITASYKNRVSIAPLINDTTGQYKSRTTVYCKLIMTKKLLSPDIRFEFDFPSINENVKSSIMNILSDENERNRQVFAFLMFRSFIPPLVYSENSNGGVTAGNAAASTGSEFLSAKMNSIFQSAVGNMLGDLDIGFNYNPGSHANSDEVMMNMNKNFFNNRLTIEGNFGVNNNRNTTANANFIGDVNIEYKLTPDGKYKARGFNRTNDITQVTVTGGLYTQGIGIGINESFENWNDLFRKYLSAKNKKP